MSYCGPQWVSPYTYVGLRSTITIRSPPLGGRQKSERPDTRREYLVSTSAFTRSAAWSCSRAFTSSGLRRTASWDRRFPICCDSSVSEDQILYSHRCHFTDPHQDPDAPSCSFASSSRGILRRRAIAFRRDREVCYRHELEEAPPEVAIDVP